jgi:drug/metabolite transporter (DMT)-like permease
VLGTLLLLPAALVEGLVGVFLRLDGQTFALLVFLGVFGGALGFYLWTFALTRLTPTQVAVYVNLNPLVATVLGGSAPSGTPHDHLRCWPLRSAVGGAAG